MTNANSIDCPHCNAANPYTAKYCISCGNNLAQISHSPYQTPLQQDEPPMIANFIYAGFWKRLVAYIIDSIILGLIIFGIITSVFNDRTKLENPEFDLFVLFSISLLPLFIWLFYFAIFESTNQQATIGKRILGIKVTDMQGHPLSFSHALGRQLSGIVSSISFYVGYLLAAFTSRKQALHDIIASAVVVNKNFGPQQIALVNQNPPSGMNPAAIIGIIFLILLIPLSGIIAAIALPAYQDYTIRASVHSAYQHADSSTNAISV